MQKLFYIIILAGFFFHSHAPANATRPFKTCSVMDSPGQAYQQTIACAYTDADSLLTVINGDDNDEQDIKSAAYIARDLFHVPHKVFHRPAGESSAPACAYPASCRLSVLYSVFRL